MFSETSVRWIGILVCLAHSAMFSGLTLGLFGLSRLRLEVQAESGRPEAQRILTLRADANFLLAALLWGNVGINVLLTLITESVLTGLSAFAFSTVVITCVGEIAPQAYFSRHALHAGSVLVPLVKVYQILLWPVAKPTALILDRWLGKEGTWYFREREIQVLLQHHAASSTTDIDVLESIGAINFLTLDDVVVEQEGERVNPQSVISLDTQSDRVQFPSFTRESIDPFLQQVYASGEKWVIITDQTGTPQLVLDADHLLRDAMFATNDVRIQTYCHRPVLITRPGTKLGKVLSRLRVHPEHAQDDVIDHDLVLYWTADEQRVITGADILGRLLRGIAGRARIQRLQLTTPSDDHK
jgi:metal transporter CNNM